MVAPQVVQNGYVATPPQAGVLRFHHGKMTSSYHVRRRQDNERHQKESYRTGHITNPLNRYTRRIGDGVGIDRNKINNANKPTVINLDPQIIDLEDDGVNPDLEVGPQIPDGSFSGDAGAMWGYFMPLNSFTSKCKKCHLVLKLPSSGEKLGKSDSPMVQHLMKCLGTEEYKQFIQKRETRYDGEKKVQEKIKKQEVESDIKTGPKITSVKRDAPIWKLFKKMNDSFATCLANNCFKVIRIIRDSATAMILHLADDHPKLHDVYNEHYSKSLNELEELIKLHQGQERLEKVEKIRLEKANKEMEKSKEGPDAAEKQISTKSLLLNAKNLIEGISSDTKPAVVKLEQDNEDFSNTSSTLREFFVPIGKFVKCNTCLTTLKPGDNNNEETSKLEKHLKESHVKQYEIYVNKRDDKKKKQLEKKQRKEKRRKEREEKQSEQGKKKKENEDTKQIMKEDCKKAINRSSGTSKMMWQYFHQLPNSEMVKCLKCHRVFRRWKNSLGDTTVLLMEHLQNYHKDLHKLFAI